MGAAEGRQPAVLDGPGQVVLVEGGTIIRTDNQGDHACAVTTSGLEALDKLLHLPYFDLDDFSQYSTRDTYKAQQGGRSVLRWRAKGGKTAEESLHSSQLRLPERHSF